MGMQLPFDVQCQVAGLPKPAPEQEFHPERGWRLDWAWSEPYKVAVEVHGGIHKRGADGQRGGRHNRGNGFTEDREKINAAQLLGWLVIEATTDQVASGQALRWAEEALRARGWKGGRT